jgi:hypothetical protein
MASLAWFIHEQWLLFASAPGLKGYFPGRHQPIHGAAGKTSCFSRPGKYPSNPVSS